VFFDNLQVFHTRGPLLEETHYYPFGLTMAGISSKALNFGAPPNKSKFNNGNELQSNEFNDASGLDTYDAVHRMYDPQIGRFFQPDELAEVSEALSPYTFSSNNPIVRNDPSGLLDTIVLSNVNVFGFKNRFAKINFYYRLRDHEISIDKLVNNQLREQMYAAEAEVNTLNRNAEMIRNEDETFLGLASWFIPETELLKILKLRKVLLLFKLKRGASSYKLLRSASEFGIKSYKELRALVKGTGLEVHHLIEKRFANLIGVAEKDMSSIVLTEAEHRAFTNAWRAEIGYATDKATELTTKTATRADVEDVARRIYAGYPEILKALGL